MTEMISLKHVGVFKWESIVESPNCLYYFYAWTKRGAERLAQEQVHKENKP